MLFSDLSGEQQQQEDGQAETPMTKPVLGDNCCSSLFCSISQKRVEHTAGQPRRRAAGLRARLSPSALSGARMLWPMGCIRHPLQQRPGLCLPRAARWKPGWKCTQQGKVLPIQLQGTPLTLCFVSSVCKKAAAGQVKAVRVQGAAAQRPPGLSQTAPSALGARKKLSWALHWSSSTSVSSVLTWECCSCRNQSFLPTALPEVLT